MQELLSQLARLYLHPEVSLPDATPRVIDPVTQDAVRVVVIPFDVQPEHSGAARWAQLCAVANALQGELGLPAPAVSVSGATGFRLWLSFAEPVPVPKAQHFLALLRTAYFDDVMLPAAGVRAPVAFPPGLNGATGKWAAFIHPGMGASFEDEPALDMPPPAMGQVALLQGLDSISPAQLQRAMGILQPDIRQPDVPQPAAAVPPAVQSAQPVQSDTAQGLLLKDATLEDIVRHLHALNIEPTFRHVLVPR